MGFNSAFKGLINRFKPRYTDSSEATNWTAWQKC